MSLSELNFTKCFHTSSHLTAVLGPAEACTKLLAPNQKTLRNTDEHLCVPGTHTDTKLLQSNSKERVASGAHFQKPWHLGAVKLIPQLCANPAESASHEQLTHSVNSGTKFCIPENLGSLCHHTFPQQCLLQPISTYLLSLSPLQLLQQITRSLAALVLPEPNQAHAPSGPLPTSITEQTSKNMHFQGPVLGTKKP